MFCSTVYRNSRTNLYFKYCFVKGYQYTKHKCYVYVKPNNFKSYYLKLGLLWGCLKSQVQPKCFYQVTEKLVPDTRTMVRKWIELGFVWWFWCTYNTHSCEPHAPSLQCRRRVPRGEALPTLRPAHTVTAGKGIIPRGMYMSWSVVGTASQWL